MTDITAELRSLARWLRQLATHEPEPECKASHVDCADDCVEAADEIDRLRDANRYLIDISNEAMEDARKYAEAQREIARLRKALSEVIRTKPQVAANPRAIVGSDDMIGWNVHNIARAALAPVEAK